MGKHADYPHSPGMLYDCPECEARCYCGDLTRETHCVHCEIQRERRERRRW